MALSAATHAPEQVTHCNKRTKTILAKKKFWTNLFEGDVKWHACCYFKTQRGLPALSLNFSKS